MTINKLRPTSFSNDEDDLTMYSTGLDVLRVMKRAGNLASKGHERMLTEIKQLDNMQPAPQAQRPDQLIEQWDLDAWMAQALSYEYFMPQQGL